MFFSQFCWSLILCTPIFEPRLYLLQSGTYGSKDSQHIWRKITWCFLRSQTLDVMFVLFGHKTFLGNLQRHHNSSKLFPTSTPSRKTNSEQTWCICIDIYTYIYKCKYIYIYIYVLYCHQYPVAHSMFTRPSGIGCPQLSNLRGSQKWGNHPSKKDVSIHRMGCIICAVFFQNSGQKKWCEPKESFGDTVAYVQTKPLTYIYVHTYIHYITLHYVTLHYIK